MSVVQDETGAWVDSNGNRYNSYSEAASGGKGGGGAMGGMAGAALGIFIIGPIIAAKIIGFLWGLLLKLGFVGRILTTLLMLAAGPFLILIPIALAVMAGGSVDFGSGNLGDILMTILVVGSVLIPAAWYFLWHYETVNVMGASEFSSRIKTYACFVWFGTIIGMIIGTISGNGAIGGVISIGATIAGVIHYFLKTRGYAREAADNPELNIPSAVKLGVMAGIVAFVVLGSIFTDRSIDEAGEIAMIEAEKNAATSGNISSANIITAQQLIGSWIDDESNRWTFNTDGTVVIGALGSTPFNVTAEGLIITFPDGTPVKMDTEISSDGSSATLKYDTATGLVTHYLTR